jgi:biopolymer transport protein ExbD
MDAGPAPQTKSAPSPFDEDTLIPSKPIADDARFDVTAMVDLVFMMNIFFLVTWTNAANAEIELPVAQHCTAADRDNSTIFTITKGPTVYIGDARPGGALTPAEVDAKVQQETEKGAVEGKMTVLIKAEKDVPVRDVIHIGQVATSVRGTNLMLAVVEKK